jgi:hypothetical protein
MSKIEDKQETQKVSNTENKQYRKQTVQKISNIDNKQTENKQYRK